MSETSNFVLFYLSVLCFSSKLLITVTICSLLEKHFDQALAVICSLLEKHSVLMKRKTTRELNSSSSSVTNPAMYVL